MVQKTVPENYRVAAVALLCRGAVADRRGQARLRPVTNKSNALPRTAAIGTNPAGTGAHAIASGLAAVASKATPFGSKSTLQWPQRLDAAVG